MTTAQPPRGRCTETETATAGEIETETAGEIETDGRAAAGPGAVTIPDTDTDTDTDAEHGAGTVLVLGVVAAVLVLAVALGALAQAQAARGTAQTGADLAALAAATAARDGWEPCGRAREAAAHNRVVVVACTEQGAGVVRVDVESRAGVTFLGASLGRANAAARAGPASAR
ncbi:Rv3654c family TadE-like protein [Cellulosimicrobium sp. BE325]|uniref:Rv3654c family TadE-like protein n=1 Tax=Cellulosimicrobium sp. 4261 TaxID=3156458 RepID=UPI001AE4CAC9